MIKGIINVFTKVKPISDIYKDKISCSSFIYKGNSAKLLKYICKKDLSVYFLMFRSKLFRIHHSSFLTQAELLQGNNDFGGKSDSAMIMDQSHK